MRSPSAPPSRTQAGHRLAPPTPAAVVHALGRHLGPERARAVWAQACRATGVAATVDGAMPLAELARPVAHLRTLPPPIALVGTSYTLRLRTHALLAAQSRPTSKIAAPTTPTAPLEVSA